MNASPTETQALPMPATKTVEVTKRIHVWDDPASKIQFMESVGKGKDWMTSIYADPDSGEKGRDMLRDLAHGLEKKGYICSFNHDEEHHLDRLYVHHLGDENGLIANIHELGFAEGAKQTMTHLSGSLNAMLHQGTAAFHYLTADKARLLSGFYLVGDVAYMFSSKGESKSAVKLEKELANLHSPATHALPELNAKITQAQIKDTLNESKDLFKTSAKLKDLSGWFATAQSLIYLYYARDTGEVAVGRFQKDVERALKKGQDPLNPDNWHERRHLPGPLGKIDEVMRRHPIEAGAYTQMTGQAAMVAGGIARMMSARGGLGHHPAAMHQAMNAGAWDAGRGLTSIAAWELLKMDPKPHHEGEEKPHWYNPERWLQLVQEHPQKASSIVNTGASLIGLKAAGHNNNMIQRGAEAAYLMGDGTMFMLNKAHYGGSGEIALTLGAEAATKLICDSNIVFGWQEEGDFVKRLSSYIGRRIVEETTHEKDFADHKTYLDALDTKSAAIGPKLGLAITEKLANRGRRLGSISHAAALVVHEFPAEQQKAVIAALAAALSKTKAIYAAPEEFNLVITAETAKMAEVDITHPAIRPQPTLSQLSEKISDLIMSLPGYDVGSSASRVYDVLQPHCLAQKADASVMQKSLKETASKAQDLPPAHQLQLAAANHGPELARS